MDPSGPATIGNCPICRSLKAPWDDQCFGCGWKRGVNPKLDETVDEYYGRAYDALKAQHEDAKRILGTN